MKFLQSLVALQLAAKVNESELQDIDVADYSKTTIPHEYWTEHVVYKGVNIFKHVYDTPFPELSRAEHELWNPDHHRGSGHISHFSGQESYLGYSPDHDLFIMGFDGWMTTEEEDEDNYGDMVDVDSNVSPCIAFKINASNPDRPLCNIVEIRRDVGSEGMWYAKHGGRSEMRRKYPDMIDIRLD